MAFAMGRYAGLLRSAAIPVASSSSSTTCAGSRNLSASVRRYQGEGENEKPPHRSASDEPSASKSSNERKEPSTPSAEASGYEPPSRAGTWPFDSTASNDASSSSADASSSSDHIGSSSNPYKGLFDGNDPFPTSTVQNLDPAPSSPGAPSSSNQASWLSDQLDSLTSPRPPRSSSDRSPDYDGRKKHPIPRSVLFADSERARQSEHFRPRPAAASRKRFDRTPLTPQEANAFMSLLNQALAGTSTPASSPLSSSDGDEREETPFGSYTSLISNPKTQSGSKALLQAFATRNRLKRFEEARAQRAKRFVREGLAGRVDPLLLEAGIDEAREQIASCQNLVELLEWAKREVWGIGASSSVVEVPAEERLATALEDTTLPTETQGKAKGPKYGKDTAYYPSVLQLLFLTIRDRYRSPHVALTIPRTTRSLGIESYVLGVTGSLYNEVLKTQWDWLGDLSGVVSTLRQARHTGILSAPLKHSLPPPKDQERAGAGLATSEDESIRDTVDRIANEVRKHVLDQQDANPLAQGFASGRLEKVKRDWSQEWLLGKAEEATGLAGSPFRLLQKRSGTGTGMGLGRFDKEKEGSAREGARFDGGRRMTPRPFKRNDGGGLQPRRNRDERDARDAREERSSPSRYSQYNTRSPRARSADFS